ncbi:unnamed protein product [Rotaria magnacalcarata]|nr:unnamed protein product [Rotaria magnacalcarata]
MDSQMEPFKFLKANLGKIDDPLDLQNILVALVTKRLYQFQKKIPNCSIEDLDKFKRNEKSDMDIVAREIEEEIVRETMKEIMFDTIANYPHLKKYLDDVGQAMQEDSTFQQIIQRIKATSKTTIISGLLTLATPYATSEIQRSFLVGDLIWHGQDEFVKTFHSINNVILASITLVLGIIPTLSCINDGTRYNLNRQNMLANRTFLAQQQASNMIREGVMLHNPATNKPFCTEVLNLVKQKITPITEQQGQQKNQEMLVTRRKSDTKATSIS